MSVSTDSRGSLSSRWWSWCTRCCSGRASGRSIPGTGAGLSRWRDRPGMRIWCWCWLSSGKIIIWPNKWRWACFARGSPPRNRPRKPTKKSFFRSLIYFPKNDHSKMTQIMAKKLRRACKNSNACLWKWIWHYYWEELRDTNTFLRYVFDKSLLNNKLTPGISNPKILSKCLWSMCPWSGLSFFQHRCTS